MKLIIAKPSRLHCSHCDETYNLPQNGNIRIYKVKLFYILIFFKNKL